MSHSTVLSLALLVSMFLPSLSREPIDLKHGVHPPPLSMQMFQDSIISSIDNVFESAGADYDSRISWWTNYTSQSWDIFMEEDDRMSPFVVCHDGRGMPGRERFFDAMDFFSGLSTDRSIGTKNLEELELDDNSLTGPEPTDRIIYNTESLTCLYAMARPAELLDLESYRTPVDVSIVIQPLMAEMKASIGLALILTDNDYFSEWWGGSKITSTFRDRLREFRSNTDDVNENSRHLQSPFDFSDKTVRIDAMTCSKIPKLETEREGFLAQIWQQVSGDISSTLETEEFYVGIAGMVDIPVVSPDKCSEWMLSTLIKPKALMGGRGLVVEVPPPPISFIFNGTHTTTAWVSSCVAVGVAALLKQREICQLSIRQDPKLLNTEALWITQGGGVSGYSPFYDAGLRGEGQVVAVSDTGLDTGSCYFRDENHDTSLQKNDVPVDYKHRKVIQYISYADGSDESGGHGTHVAGSIAGKSIEGSDVANGIAENAKISFFDAGTIDGDLLFPTDTYNEILKPGYVAGAKVHSASWGGLSNTYSYSSFEFDRFAYFHQDFLILVAAGNDGENGLKSVGEPATAKNIISVGATETIDDKNTSLGMNYLAFFSSRGPASDGRIKPDVVAPGYFIVSANAEPGESQSCSTLWMAGTSMSTPITSGNALLIRQYFEEGYHSSGEKQIENGFKPTAALVKAVLLNGAQPILGINTDDGVFDVSPYDENQGFGRISLIDSLPLAGNNTIAGKFVDRRVLGLSKNDIFNITINTRDGKCNSTLLSVMLVWTDPYGYPSCGKCLINDLDLEVTMGGVEYFPNGRMSKDNTNNAERVQVNVKDGDTLSIRIVAMNLVTSNQTYAMAMTGCFNITSEEYESTEMAMNYVPEDPIVGLITGTIL
eukprot:CAMPEP_0194270124 /NCGR_PEP_ID=MMETSP0169-20130528/4172_1 /TAXON_ID=218684 /ORGANISM="Corethron pennatum, Strain L29A3" /LENGTH=884 /DNA_ID=CAMNT_0039012057 /DNA_START=1 /DNA_END=2656 /DNA_ORIENTATION=+